MLKGLILANGAHSMSLAQTLRDLHEKGEGRREFFEMLSAYTNWRTDMQAAGPQNTLSWAMRPLLDSSKS